MTEVLAPEVSGSGPTPMERPEEFNRVVLEFLAKAVPAP